MKPIFYRYFGCLVALFYSFPTNLHATSFLDNPSQLREDSEPTFLTQHAPQRVQLGLGVQELAGTYIKAGYRLGLHDWLDPIQSYPKHTSIEFLQIQLRLFNSGAFWLDDVVLVRVRRLPPQSSESDELSWTAEAGFDTHHGTACNQCTLTFIRGSLGLTEDLGDNSPVEGFILMEGELGFSPAFTDSSFLPMLGLQTGLRFYFSTKASAIARAFFRVGPLAPHVVASGISLQAQLELATHHALQLGLSALNDGMDAGLSYSAYF